MAQVIDVAKYITFLSYTDGEPEPLTTLKLQKMLYYAQALSLAKRGEALFSDKIKAWRDGPVIPAVWHEFKKYGRDIPDINEKIELSIEDRVFLRQVWKVYGQFTGDHLSTMTHTEKPWRDAWGALPSDAHGEVEIEPQAMADFYAKQDVNLPEVPRPVEIRKGREVYRIEDAGKVFPVGIW